MVEILAIFTRSDIKVNEELNMHMIIPLRLWEFTFGATWFENITKKNLKIFNLFSIFYFWEINKFLYRISYWSTLKRCVIPSCRRDACPRKYLQHRSVVWKLYFTVLNEVFVLWFIAAICLPVWVLGTYNGTQTQIDFNKGAKKVFLKKKNYSS